MHRHLTSLVAAVTLVAVVSAAAGIATAEQPTTSIKDDVHAEFNGGFSPKTLSEKKPTPVSPWISGKLESRSGAHVAAMRKLVLEADEDTSVSVKGVPLCESGVRSQQRLTPADVLRMCREALVGRGRMEAEIEFVGETRLPVRSKLFVFNGGFKGGVTTLYLHAYFTVPTSAAIVTTVKIERIRKGRFGLRAVARIPKIAGGSGSVTFFKLKLKKGILSARCTDGRLDLRVTPVFASPPPQKLTAALRRPCTAR